MKLGGYMIMIVTMIMFLQFIGIPTGAQTILKYVGVEINDQSGYLNNADLESSSFFDKIFNNLTGILFIIGAAGVVIIGLFGRGYDTSLVIVGLVIAVGSAFASTFWTIIKFMQGFGVQWATNIVALIFVGVGLGFIIACVDYFAGR